MNPGMMDVSRYELTSTMDMLMPCFLGSKGNLAMTSNVSRRIKFGDGRHCVIMVILVMGTAAFTMALTILWIVTFAHGLCFGFGLGV